MRIFESRSESRQSPRNDENRFGKFLKLVASCILEAQNWRACTRACAGRPVNKTGLECVWGRRKKDDRTKILHAQCLWRRSIERRPNPRTFRMLRFGTSWSDSTNFVLSLNWFSKKGHTCHSEEFVQARSIGLVLFLFGGYLLIKWYVLNKILLSTDNLGLIEICPSRHQLHVRRNGMNTIFCAIGLSCIPKYSTIRF